jgi:hypothetical protein
MWTSFEYTVLQECDSLYLASLAYLSLQKHFPKYFFHFCFVIIYEAGM